METKLKSALLLDGMLIEEKQQHPGNRNPYIDIALRMARLIENLTSTVKSEREAAKQRVRYYVQSAREHAA